MVKITAITTPRTPKIAVSKMLHQVITIKIPILAKKYNKIPPIIELATNLPINLIGKVNIFKTKTKMIIAPIYIKKFILFSLI